MCEEEQPTVSMIAPLKAKVLEHFSLSEEDLILVREMKQTMVQELQQWYVEVSVLSEEQRDTTFQCLIHEAAELWDKKER